MTFTSDTLTLNPRTKFDDRKAEFYYLFGRRKYLYL